MLELYGMQSPNVRKIGIMLEELELEYQLKHVAVFQSEQFSPEFLNLNPLSKVPVLIDHDRGQGKPIIESGAILFYLAETYGNWLPETGMQRYEIMSWLMVQMANIGPMFGQHNHFQLLGKQADPYAATRYANQCKRLYRLLDDRLTAQQWLAGDSYSIADIATYPWSLYLEQHGFNPDDHPALMNWRNVIGERHAVKNSSKRFDEAFNTISTESRRSAKPEQLDKFFGREENSPQADFSALTKI